LARVRSESDAATSCSAALMADVARSTQPRLCIVDYREHLPALYAISLMYAEFHDVPHHLARQLCGFRRAYRSHCFQQIGNVNPLHRQHETLRTVSGAVGVGCRSLAQPLSPARNTARGINARE